MSCNYTSFGKVRFAWGFPCDYTSGGEVLTATSQAGNMVKENLVNHQPAMPWRSTAATAQIITGRLGAVGTIHPVRFLLLYAHNLSSGAVIRLQLSQLSDFSAVNFDKTWGYSYPSVGFGDYPFGLQPFGEGARIGGAGYNPFLLEFFENKENAAYYKLTVTDTGNSDGYIQIGRMAMGDYWEPENNIEWRYTQARIQVGAKGTESRSGALYARNRGNYRAASMSFAAITENDEQYLDLMSHEAGDFYNVLFTGYPGAGGETERRHVLLGFATESGGIARENLSWRSKTLTIREAV